MSILLLDAPIKVEGYTKEQDVYYMANYPVVMDVLDYVLKNQAVLASDFDGVVADTERHQMKAFGDVARIHCTHKLTPEQLDALSLDNLAERMVGRTERDILTTLKDEYSLVQSVDELVELRGKQYVASVYNSNLQANPFTRTLYQQAHRNLPLKPVIVSNGRYAVQSDLLQRFGCAKYFHAVKTCDVVMPDLEMSRRKKAYYEHLFNKFDGNVVVLEDSASMARYVQDELKGQVIFVRHSLNRKKAFRPQSGWTLHSASMYRGLTPNKN